MKKRSSLRYILIVLITFLVAGGVIVFARRKSNFLPERPVESSGSSSLQGETLQDQKELSPSVIVTQKVGQKAPGFFLEVTSPQDGATVASDRIQVKGKTVPLAEVWVNENQTVADRNGNFSVAVSLEEGENYLLVSAGNENGQAEVERMVYYEK